ncbi:phosphate butyryltransferase [Anaerobranca californiensis DSM 14826]|jgi:phosphate butyryltransferase|uniref:Phosphate butyryltransferase n=1 Tax=Anaerobranca californiensis DSM 14826 TaxID=1120989 RepID=A0A1M6L524_9FIRM|nr:phosphate butyryltransferase [Anaerobranca californiensis]SHJ66312.1 phosphate butyryltransferase [Anaerobranca californiensis DSM 14826]
MLTSISQIIEKAKQVPKQTLVVAAAEDNEVLAAVSEGVSLGIVDAILVGDEERIKEIAQGEGYDISQCRIINEQDKIKAARKSVEMVSQGEASLVMKGLIGTADILRAVLDKEIGLRTGRVLSHVAVLEIQGYDKLFLLTDGAMNIAPDLSQKAQIVQNAVSVAHALGIDTPKVAPLAAVELVNPDMQATLDAANLSKMADRGQIKGCIIDGPLALDNAVSLEAAEHKGIVSPVAGNADILLVPDIEAGNVLYKSIVYFANAKTAGLIAGAKAPVVLTSRSDTHEAKLNSIALGVLVAANR